MPKFILNRFQGSINLQMNEEMARSLLGLLNEFSELDPHEYALRERLQNMVEMAQQREAA